MTKRRARARWWLGAVVLAGTVALAWCDVSSKPPRSLETARCAARFEPELEHQCGWEMVAVLHRTSEDTDELVYARADLTLGADQPACRALASCTTEAWVHREQVPMPPSLGPELSFSQTGRGSSWHPSKGVDIESHYRRHAAQERRYLETLEAAARGPTQVTPSSLGWNMLFARHRIDDSECMLDAIDLRDVEGRVQEDTIDLRDVEGRVQEDAIDLRDVEGRVQEGAIDLRDVEGRVQEDAIDLRG